MILTRFLEDKITSGIVTFFTLQLSVRNVPRYFLPTQEKQRLPFLVSIVYKRNLTEDFSISVFGIKVLWSLTVVVSIDFK